MRTRFSRGASSNVLVLGWQGSPLLTQCIAEQETLSLAATDVVRRLGEEELLGGALREKKIGAVDWLQEPGTTRQQAFISILLQPNIKHTAVVFLSQAPAKRRFVTIECQQVQRRHQAIEASPLACAAAVWRNGLQKLRRPYRACIILPSPIPFFMPSRTDKLQRVIDDASRLCLHTVSKLYAEVLVPKSLRNCQGGMHLFLKIL